jgi:membrane protease YdiL (CAAX protease family)
VLTPVVLIRRYPLIAFAVLACLLGWLPSILAVLGLGSAGNLPLGPAFAAAIIAACQGRDELRGWWRRVLDWRARPAWYAAAFVVPLLVDVAIVAVNHLFGAPLPTSGQLAGWTELPLTFAFILLLIGVGEEAGWTAFAAPMLLRRNGIWGAWAVLGPIRVLWHLPLMLTGELPWVVGIVGNLGFQFLLLCLWQAAGQRWSPAALWHATLNTVGGAFFFPMVTGADNARLGVLLAVAYGLLATAVAVVVALAGPDARHPLRRRRPSGTPSTGTAMVIER